MMDEIDAALDTRNVSIIGHYIKVRFVTQTWNLIKRKMAFLLLMQLLCGWRV
jgi:hypothetical protein